MPTTLTPGLDLNAAIDVPNAGESRTALSVRTPFQAVADRLGGIVDGALLTLLDSRRELNVQSGGTRTNFDIDIGGIAAIMLRTGTGGRHVHSTAGGSAVVTEAHVSGGDLGAVAKAWYVYAYRSGGSLTWEVSDTAPDATRTVKSTDSTRCYFGCFLTDSSGSPIPVRAVGGHYAYRLSAAGTAVRALSVVPATPPATSFTNIDLSPFLPPHARIARLYAAVTNADATNWGKAQFRTDGETGYQVDVHCAPAGAAHDGGATLAFDLEVSSSRIIEYRRENASSYANLSIALFVTGWKE